MTCSDIYFFTFTNSHLNTFNIDHFDIKEYLILLGSEDTVNASKYREKYGSIEEEYIKEWIEALLPYFKRNELLQRDLKLSTRNEIYLEQKNDVNELNYLEESQENWIGEPRVLKTFLSCLERITDSFTGASQNVDKLFPMICQVVDDYRADKKIIGVALLKEFIRIVPVVIFKRFNLQIVIYESLKVNFTFESDELVIKSIDLWIELIGKVEVFRSEEFLKRCDELLLLFLRDIGNTSKLERKMALLNGLNKLIELMKYCTIRYLRKLLITICEVIREDFTKNELVKSGEQLTISIIKNCWIRLRGPEAIEIRKIVLETFGGCEEIENLLKLLNED